QKLAEYLVLYNSKRPHKALALMTPVEYILKENKNCNMWWTHTRQQFRGRFNHRQFRNQHLNIFQEQIGGFPAAE
ncbi:hypothetical protein ACTTDO_23170, partial [Escherichia coli]